MFSLTSDKQLQQINERLHYLYRIKRVVAIKRAACLEITLVNFILATMSEVYIPIKRRVTTDEMLSAVRKTYPRRSLIQRHRLDTWQIDLIDLSNLSRHNDGYKYVLMVVDIFSKVGFGEKLKTKISKEVAAAMNSIFQKSKCVPKNIHVSFSFSRFSLHLTFCLFLFRLQV